VDTSTIRKVKETSAPVGPSQADIYKRTMQKLTAYFGLTYSAELACAPCNLVAAKKV